jgi:hypothetical protein
MDDFGLRPRPPHWALHAGLPEPHADEGFCEYVIRLGFSDQEMLEGLTERTMPLANWRLATRLQRSMPQHFSEYIDRLVEEHVPSERRNELRLGARRIWGDRERRPAGMA